MFNKNAVAQSNPDLSLRAEALGWSLFTRFFSAWAGAALLLAGVICFFAYNWANMHKFTKFALLLSSLLFLLILAFLSDLKSFSGRLALFLTATFIGPLLAVYGQVYQTGADPWQLFAVWSFMMLLMFFANAQKELLIGAWLLGTLAFFLFENRAYPTYFLDNPKVLDPFCVWLFLSFFFWELGFYLCKQLQNQRQQLNKIFLPKAIPYTAASLFVLIQSIKNFDLSGIYIFAFTKEYSALYQAFLFFLCLLILAAWDAYIRRSIFVLSLGTLSIFSILVRNILPNYSDISVQTMFFSVGVILTYSALTIKGLTSLHKKFKPTPLNKRSILHSKSFIMEYLALSAGRNLKTSSDNGKPFALRLLAGLSVWISLPLFMVGIVLVLGDYFFYNKDMIIVVGLVLLLFAAILARGKSDFSMQSTAVLGLAAGFMIAGGLITRVLPFDFYKFSSFFVFVASLLVYLSVRNLSLAFCSGLFCYFSLFAFINSHLTVYLLDIFISLHSHPLMVSASFIIYSIFFLFPTFMLGTAKKNTENIPDEGKKLRKRCREAWFYGSFTAILLISLLATFADTGIYNSIKNELFGTFILSTLGAASALTLIFSVFILCRHLKLNVKNIFLIYTGCIFLGILSIKNPWLCLALTGIILGRNRESPLITNAMTFFIMASISWYYYSTASTLLAKAISLGSIGLFLLLLSSIFTRYAARGNAIFLNELEQDISTGTLENRLYYNFSAQDHKLEEQIYIKAMLDKEAARHSSLNKLKRTGFFKAIWERCKKGKELNKILYLTLVLLVFIGLFIHSAAKKEKLLHSGAIAIFELMPIDPRSLMQGDYMIINLKLEDYIYHDLRKNDLEESAFLRGTAIIKIDKKTALATYIRLDDGSPLIKDEKKLKYKYSRTGRASIGSGAFFFQEGLAKKYDKTRYAVMRLNEDGTVLTTDLLENINSH